MRSRSGPGKKASKGAAPGPRTARSPALPGARTRELLDRLTQGVGNVRKAAEELDRHLPSAEREGRLPQIRADVEALCGLWAAQTLRGERAAAFLTLVGALGLDSGVRRTAELSRDPGLASPLRGQACTVLGVLGGPVADAVLVEVVRESGDPSVRAAAARALADLGDPACLPVLRAATAEVEHVELHQALTEAIERLSRLES